ncbi:hypothetical protein L1987_74814 [Smallanthus sonchifolius]|uniref:Uncharacterized protein n=1 Tax=Smallanthus sonchifolius TaxID=185202 RepID=A0ACB9A4M0_9ASTR|nr:hypothetical protein L1987_74814 [Smallanthus sonchifolius]
MADEDQANLERIFKRFDANGDGKISSTELGEALKTLGSVSPEEVQRMMGELDTDGDGFISYQEYMDFCNKNRGLMRDVAKIVFEGTCVTKLEYEHKIKLKGVLGLFIDQDSNILIPVLRFYGVHKFLLFSMIKLIKLLHRDSIILLLFCGHGNHQGKNGYPNNGRGGGRGGNVAYREEVATWVVVEEANSKEEVGEGWAGGLGMEVIYSNSRLKLGVRSIE